MTKSEYLTEYDGIVKTMQMYVNPVEEERSSDGELFPSVAEE
jgi:hypothetical protein